LLPALLVKESALENNIAVMAEYCRLHHLSFAPHAKTPLAPQIVERQLAAGAWGITTATIYQTRVFRAMGVRRILLANELVEPQAIAWIAREQDRDEDFEFFCLVDSPAGVAVLEETLAQVGARRSLAVLIELGAFGGRAGCRTREEAVAVARAVRSAQHVRLAGVETYEAPIDGATLDERIARVDAFLHQVREIASHLAGEGFFGDGEIVVSAGGSIFFDRVAEILGPPWHLPVRTVVRAGSYVAQDIDLYERLSPLAGRGDGQQRLRPALELWSVILSLPEDGLAIAGFGKRDVSHDLALPTPLLLRRGDRAVSIAGEIEVTALNDHHAFLRVAPGVDLAVGELIGLGISHPCTAFDKWHLLPLVDDSYTVTGAIRTFF
jgi:D-serine dehydratase